MELEHATPAHIAHDGGQFRTDGSLEYLGRDPVTPDDMFRIDKQSVSSWALSVVTRLRPQFPLLPWLPLSGNSGWRDLLLGDAFGGLTAGFLLIPQGAFDKTL